jgi:hypothetical protein
LLPRLQASSTPSRNRQTPIGHILPLDVLQKHQPYLTSDREAPPPLSIQVSNQHDIVLCKSACATWKAVLGVSYRWRFKSPSRNRRSLIEWLPTFTPVFPQEPSCRRGKAVGSINACPARGTARTCPVEHPNCELFSARFHSRMTA